jgi:hypothetical protein
MKGFDGAMIAGRAAAGQFAPADLAGRGADDDNGLANHPTPPAECPAMPRPETSPPLSPWNLAAWIALPMLIAGVGAGCSRKAAPPAPESPAGVSGFAEEESRALRLLEKDAAGATKEVEEPAPEKPAPKSTPAPIDPREPLVLVAPVAEGQGGPKWKTVSQNLKVTVERWGPHYRFTKADRERIEVHPAWHQIVRMDGYKAPPTVAMRCVFRLADDTGRTMKFDHILILCAEGFAGGSCGIPNEYGDDWVSHYQQAFRVR